MRLLVLGASGLLGAEVCRHALAQGLDVAGAYRTTPASIAGVGWYQVDIRDRAAVRALVQRVRPAAVVNAAYASDDWASCADGAANVAVAVAAQGGARHVHISSDAVHGGRPEPYRDDEPPTPITAYGAAKAAGETAVRAIDTDAVVVRTSLILGDSESKQVRFCLDLISGTRRGAFFADEVRCPIAVEDLAAAVLELVPSTVSGLLNVAGPQAVTRVELGRLVATRYDLDPDAVPVSTIAESGLVRAGLVRLDVTRAGSLLRTRLRSASEYLSYRRG